MNFLWKKEPDPPPLLPLDDGCKMDAAGLLGQHFFKRKFKMVDGDSHLIDLSVSDEEFLQH